MHYAPYPDGIPIGFIDVGTLTSNTIGMINLDAVVGGDKMYVFGGAGGEGWIREQALHITESKNIPLETSLGLNPAYPAGTTGHVSDHVPFKELGIPFAYARLFFWFSPRSSVISAPPR